MHLESAAELAATTVASIARPLPDQYWNSCPDWQQRVQKLFADEQRFRQSIDGAMRTFAATRSAPHPPAGPENFLMCCRFLCAIDTVNILLVGWPESLPLPRQNAGNDEAILNWLLIDTWNEWRWDTWLKLEVLRSLGRKDSFYAAPEFPPTGN